MSSIVVIMPVGSDPDWRQKQNIIRSSIESLGYEAIFPGYDPANPLFVPEAFADQLIRAKAVLADLTGERPSCYFELGFAEALGRPAFLIAQQGTAIHQSTFRRLVRFYRSLDDLAKAVISSLPKLDERVTTT